MAPRRDTGPFLARPGGWAPSPARAAVGRGANGAQPPTSASTVGAPPLPGPLLTCTAELQGAASLWEARCRGAVLDGLTPVFQVDTRHLLPTHPPTRLYTHVHTDLPTHTKRTPLHTCTHTYLHAAYLHAWTHVCTRTYPHTPYTLTPLHMPKSARLRYTPTRTYTFRGLPTYPCAHVRS